MAPDDSTAQPPANQVPLTHFDHELAQKAFRLHSALWKMVRDDPALIEDELLNVWLTESFLRFSEAFEVGL